jgi:hypothetical protein
MAAASPHTHTSCIITPLPCVVNMGWKKTGLVCVKTHPFLAKIANPQTSTPTALIGATNLGLTLQLILDLALNPTAGSYSKFVVVVVSTWLHQNILMILQTVRRLASRFVCGKQIIYSQSPHFCTRPFIKSLLGFIYRKQ